VVAVRLGIAPALGSAAADVPVSDTVRFQVPVQLDALWAFGPFAVGGYGSWGWARVGGCDGSCSGSVTRVGLQGTWTAPPVRGAEPWAGVAAGYEWATERRALPPGDVTTGWRGFELLALQGGIDWRLRRNVAIGPFLLVGGGRYTDVTLDTGVDSASADLANKAVHVWVHLGVRLRLVLGGAP
jgi:hypothetical protein